MTIDSLPLTIGENTEAEVFFDWQPYEPSTQTDPGCHAEAVITSVFVNDGDFLDDLHPSCVRRLECEIFLYMTQQDDGGQ